jgi:hypothetical protein
MEKLDATSALQLKNIARAHRESGRLVPALQEIRKAVAGLEVTLAGLEAELKPSGTADAKPIDYSPKYRGVIQALAECYGVQGGIYRSLAQPEESIESYDRGYLFESHPGRNRDNSYNLVQRLTSRILADPVGCWLHEWKYKGIHLWVALSEAREVVLHQMQEGGRSRDQWAAADIVLLCVLLAPRAPAQGKAELEDALGRFYELDYDAFVYDSSIRALSELYAALSRVTSGGDSAARGLVCGLLQITIERFKQLGEIGR